MCVFVGLLCICAFFHYKLPICYICSIFSYFSSTVFFLTITFCILRITLYLSYTLNIFFLLFTCTILFKYKCFCEFSYIVYYFKVGNSVIFSLVLLILVLFKNYLSTSSICRLHKNFSYTFRMLFEYIPK